MAFAQAILGFRCRVQHAGMAIVVRDPVETISTHCPHPEPSGWSSCRIQVSDVDALQC